MTSNSSSLNELDIVVRGHTRRSSRLIGLEWPVKGRSERERATKRKQLSNSNYICVDKSSHLTTQKATSFNKYHNTIYSAIFLESSKQGTRSKVLEPKTKSIPILLIFPSVVLSFSCYFEGCWCVFGVQYYRAIFCSISLL